jgi:hypothetical protein
MADMCKENDKRRTLHELVSSAAVKFQSSHSHDSLTSGGSGASQAFLTSEAPMDDGGSRPCAARHGRRRHDLLPSLVGQGERKSVRGLSSTDRYRCDLRHPAL